MPTQKKKILLTEDNVITGLATKTLLNRFGFDTIHVTTGESALEILQQDPSFNLVLMDIDLGAGLDGIEAAEQILSRSDIPIIFLSSHTEAEYLKRIKEVTRYGYIPKNSHELVLHSTIELALDLFEKYKQAQQKESKFATLFKSLTDTIFTLDTEQRHTGLYGSWVERNGLSPDYFLGKTSRDILGSKAAVVHEAANAKALTGEIVTYQWSTVLNGSTYYYQTVLSPIFNETQEVTGLIGVGRDITKEKESEKIVRQQAVWSRFINEAIITTDINLFISVWSPSAEIIYGWSDAEAIGKNIDDLLKTVFLEDTVKMAQKTLHEKGMWTGLLKQETKHGKTIIIESSVTWLKDEHNEITGGIAVNRDVTEKITALEKIKASDLRYRGLLTNLDAGVVVHAPDTSITLVNQKASELLGLSEDQLKGKLAIDPYWTFLTSSGQLLPLEEYPVNYILSTRSPMKNQVFGVVHSKGKDPIWLMVSGTPVFDESILTEVVISFTDITEVKKSEEKLNVVLNEKEIILHEVHHRIKNNMNTMASLLMLQSSSIKSKEVQDILNDAVSRIKSMGVLYDKLYRNTDVQQLHVKSYLSDLIDEVKKLFIGKEITLEKQIDDIVIPTSSLSTIGIIINELVTNGIKHAFPAQSHGQIRISLKQLDDDTILIYEDNGVGFNPESKQVHDGFGMNLISLLTKQLRGTFYLTKEKGTKIEIRFRVTTGVS
jgi:PAS domain S-box-containing protein